MIKFRLFSIKPFFWDLVSLSSLRRLCTRVGFYSDLSFFCLFFSGYGLKCYECASSKSWDDCASIRKEKTCDSSSNRCVKGMRDGGQDDVSFAFYVKGCVESSECDTDTSDFCKDSDLGKVKNCELSCCSGDLCNGGKVPMVSAIMLLACALAAFLR